MGSRSDSTSDTTKIAGALNQLENKIKSMTSGEQPHQVTASELSNIQGEFEGIAEEFYKGIPLEVEQQRFKDVSKSIEQIKQSRLIEPHIHTLEHAAEQLTQAFNKRRDAPPISVDIHPFPTNVFVDESYRMVLAFPNFRYWSSSLEISKNERLVLRIQKASGADRPDKKVFWLRDRSIWLAFPEDQSSFSLYHDLQPDLKVRVLGDIREKDGYPISDLDGIMKNVLERIFKYEALEESLTSKPQS